MFSINQIEQILFLDIETARVCNQYSELSEGLQKMWEHKSTRIEPDSTLSAEEKYYEHAGKYAEFGRVVCISIGFIRKKNDRENEIRIKSFFGQEEADILEGFKDFLNTKGKKFTFFAAHNGREFDFPFMGRRYLINQIHLPQALELRDKKPWESKHILDTMEMWKFGDLKNYTKLELLCSVFNVPTPKDDMDGSQVGTVFWDEKNLNRIAVYCEKDVVATAQVYLKYLFLPLVADENIEYAERIELV
jgi:3'-5' exonuclease